MAEFSKTEVLRWLNSQILKRDEKLALVTVVHMSGGMKSPPIDSWKADVENFEVSKLAGEIYQTIIDDANGLGNMQTYAAELYFGEAQTPNTRRPFQVYGGEPKEEGEAAIMSEPPTDKGQRAQGMRHTETLMKNLIDQTKHIVQFQARQIEMQNDRLHQMEDDRFRMMQTVEELTSRKHLRDMEIAEARHSQQMKEDLFSQFKILMPVLANKFMGGQVIPQTTTPQLETIKEVFRTIRPDQFNKLAEALEPHQIAPIIEMVSQWMDEDEKKKSSAEERLIATTGDQVAPADPSAPSTP
jgi:hypothetical protein